MSIKLNGATSGSVELDVPAVVGSDLQLTLPTTAGEFSVKDANGNVDVTSINSLNFPTAGPLSNRNYVGNGKFQVDQRNNGSAVTPGGGQTYTLDRWRIVNPGGLAPFSVQQVSTDVLPGFNYATKITLTTPATPSSSNQFFYGTSFEANELGGWKYGTADALTSTLSFHVRSSVTGTYSISLTNDANTRSFVGEYTISSANTWEYKTIEIPGDTTGTWSSTGISRHSFLQFDLGAGSNFNGTNGSWVDGNKRKTAGSVDFVNQASGSTFMLTGVQLEVGSKATPFAHESYAQTLAKSQRYCFQIDSKTSQMPICVGIMWQANSFIGVLHLPVPLRDANSIDVEVSAAGDIRILSNSLTRTVSSMSQNAHHQGSLVELHFVTSINHAQGNSAFARIISGTGKFLRVVSEL